MSTLKRKQADCWAYNYGTIKRLGHITFYIHNLYIHNLYNKIEPPDGESPRCPDFSFSLSLSPLPNYSRPYVRRIHGYRGPEAQRANCKGLEHPQILVSKGGPVTTPLQIPRNNCTVDPWTMRGLGAPNPYTLENPRVTLQSPSLSVVLHPQIQPTVGHAVL